MAGWTDIITGAQPYLATEHRSGTYSMTWAWSYYVKDNSGTLVDLTTGYTGTAKLYDATATLVVTLSVTFPVAGEIHVAATAATTATPNQPGKPSVGLLNEVIVTKTATSEKAMIVGAGGAKFTARNTAG